MYIVWGSENTQALTLKKMKTKKKSCDLICVTFKVVWNHLCIITVHKNIVHPLGITKVFDKKYKHFLRKLFCILQF